MLPTAVKLRNIKVADTLSRETTAFTAELEMNGQAIGTVENDGGGGCHVYHFKTREIRVAFQQFISDWAEAEGVAIEPDDRLINELLDHHQIVLAAHALALTASARRVLIVRKAPSVLSGERRPLEWGETYLVPLLDDAAPETVARAEAADQWEVIPGVWR
jgi:hypothetical protein